MQNYNFVIFQKHFDYYRIAYSDIIKRSDVEYIDKIKIHRSKTINSILRTPIKNILPADYFKDTFPTIKPLCFIFGARWMQYRSMQDYILYLRKHFSDARFVCFYQDLVDKHPRAEPNKLRYLFDLMLSYDKGDVEKYGLTYHPTVFSNYPVKIDKSIPSSDIYFVGVPKGRLSLILDTFFKLKGEGFECDFYLSGVSSRDQVKEKGLNYIDRMSYNENLKHVVRSKCLLEIIQNNAKGATVRTWEAIMYDKKLLTNNISVIDDFFYNKNYISLMDENGIDAEFLKHDDHYVNTYKDEIGPDRLLEFICSSFEEPKKNSINY